MNEEILQKIQSELEAINKKTPGNGMSFVRGILTGFGYVIGAGLAIIIIGWILNAVGVIPAFTRQADEWKNIFQRTQNQTFVPVDTPEAGIEQ